jgi:glycine/D-amino acid oxidase-like deaminating enzyme
MVLPDHCDVVVIGGGIVGAAAAHYLAKAGLDVVLIEKSHIASEQSGRNWGFVRQQGRDPAELPMAMDANTRVWPNLAEELQSDIEWCQSGNLVLAPNAETAHRYEEWAKDARSMFGLETNVLTMSAIRRLLPHTEQTWEAGIHTETDGHADPVKTTRSFVRSAKTHGATVLTHVTVLELLKQGNRMAGVRTDYGEIQADQVVVAAGAWSRTLLEPLGITLPQRNIATTVARTNIVGRIPPTAVWIPGTLAYRQTADGSLIVSAGGARSTVSVDPESFRDLKLFLPMFFRNISTFRVSVDVKSFFGQKKKFFTHEPAPNYALAQGNVQRFKMVFPDVGELRLERAWGGVIDGTPDALPVLDPACGPAGLVLATGLSGHGFALGPVFGETVAKLVQGKTPSYELRPMRLARFVEGDYGAPKKLF